MPRSKSTNTFRGKKKGKEYTGLRNISRGKNGIFRGKVFQRGAKMGRNDSGGGRYESSFPEIPISLYLRGRR